MKNLFIVSFLLLNINFTFAQLIWVEVHGDRQFCPGESRLSTYYINDNFSSINIANLSCERCEFQVPGSSVWVTEDVHFGRPPYSQVLVKWDEGNYDDAEIEYIVEGTKYGLTRFRSDTEYPSLVENSHGPPPSYLPNVSPTISSNKSYLSCGSTSSFTFTANWVNADSYSWSVSGGEISGSSTGPTITVIPNNGTTNVTANARGYNMACNVYSNWTTRTVERAAPVVSAIEGPNYVCYGAPSIESHYVNNISGVSYTWSGSGLIFPNGNTSRQVTVQGTSTGNKTLRVTVTGCGPNPVIKEKTVYVASGTPMYPVITQPPYQHCAGSCENYQLWLPTGYASEMQYRYNYGSWYTASSSGIASICTNSYDYGSKPVELRSIGICGNYSSTNTQTIQVTSCGYYMMATSAEDSLAISELSVENDVALYPNPASTTMTISLPEDTGETQLTIINDRNEVIATFKNKKKLFTLNTSRLGSGYYYLSIVGKNKKTTKRFLVE
jgi:hypothetical protein